MTGTENASHSPSTRTLVAVRLVAVVVLALLLWPMPDLWRHTSEGGAVFGRYTLHYFAFVTLYSLSAAAWAGVTAWLTLRLTAPRLADLRRLAQERWGKQLVAGFTLLTLTVLGLNVPVNRFHVALPFLYRQAGPVLIYGFLCCILLVALGAPSIESTVRQVNEDLDRARRGGRAGRQARAKDVSSLAGPLVVAGMAFVAGILILAAVQRGIASWPLNDDEAAHVYLGQRIASGERPYRDFLESQPPLGFALAGLWAWTAGVTGLSGVHVARVYSLGAGVTLLAVTYGIASRLTGRRVGGLFAAAILLGLEPLLDLLVAGPNLKVSTALVMMLGVWLGQRGRWFWAGAVSAAASMMWLPAGGVTASIVLAAFLQKPFPRWRPALLAVFGAALTIGSTVGLLASGGLLDSAFRQVLVSSWTWVGQESGPGGVGLFAYLFMFAALSGTHLLGDWGLLFMMVGGLLTIFAFHNRREALQNASTSVPLFAALAMLLAYAVDHQGVPDVLMAIVPLTPFGAVPLVRASAMLDSSSAGAPRYLQFVFEAVAFVMLLVYGLADPARHFEGAVFPLSRQQAMADQLDGALRDGQSVQALGNLWFLDLTNRANATPVSWYGTNTPVVVRASGSTMQEMVEDMEAEQPVVVMVDTSLLGGTDALPAWLNDQYHYAGTLTAGYTVPYEQDVYVRLGHPELDDLIAAWPLRQMSQ